MTRNMLVAILLVMAFFVSPVFADGTLNITKSSLSAPAYINTKTVTPMVNMTVNTTIGQVNITGILINLTGTASSGNVSGVFVYNDSDNDGAIDLGEQLLGSSTVNTTTNTSNITFSPSFNIAADKQYYFIIALNISSNATRLATVGLNLTSSGSIFTSNTSTTDNITITGNYVDSGLPQIQNVHATASISPSYVDTNVTNQSFRYTITPTGSDKFNNISITIPVGYSIVNVTYVGDNGTALWTTTNLTSEVSVAYGNYRILVNYTPGYNGTIIINFTVNTNITAQSLVAFNSTITGSNLTNIATDVSGSNTSVTTYDKLISIINIAAIKSTAYVNGTDYWEFNLTVNFSASVSGLLQFKMSNWNDSAGHSIALTSNLTNLATLRDSTSASNMINVSNDFNIATGVSFTGTQGSTKNVILKMVIPLGTYATTTSTWWTIYSALFRSTATA